MQEMEISSANAHWTNFFSFFGLVVAALYVADFGFGFDLDCVSMIAGGH